MHLELDSRQIVFLIWLGAAAIAVLLRGDTRRALADVGRAAVSPKILIPFVGMALYAVLIVVLARGRGIWRPDQLADTIGWFVGTAAVLFFNVNKA